MVKVKLLDLGSSTLPQFFFGGVQVKLVRNKLGMIILFSIILAAGLPRGLENSTDNLVRTHAYTPAAAIEVTGIPYVWQEINGFCMWAAVSMALQHAGVPLDLHELFAASGIGFSASYLRYEENMLFVPGVFYRQLDPLETVTSFYGLNTSIYMDPSTELGMAFLELGTNFTALNTWDEAFRFLKQTIASGHPLVLWTEPYYLPHDSYDVVREMGLTSSISGSGHAILAVGYNKTDETVQVMDPGIGAFGEDFGYPAEGSWYYSINQSSLRDAWSSMAYGAFLIKPGTSKVSGFTQQLATLIIERMRGERASYGPQEEQLFFWNFGSDAFRGLAYDLTAEGLSSYIADMKIEDVETKTLVLTILGLMFEGYLDIQYLSFRSAVDALPGLLPDLDLDEFVSICQSAFPHFEALSDNSTMVELDYSGGNTIMTETLGAIAASCNSTMSGDVHAAAMEYENELSQIRNHLTDIADLWDAAASTLACAFQDDGTLTLVVVSFSIVGILVLVVVFTRRISSM